MKSTQLLYLENFDALTCTAHVVDIVHDAPKHIIILDQTVFYPQGGGQPYDTGTITSSTGTFSVSEVRFVDGVVRHIGTVTDGHFSIGQNVTCVVEPMRRLLHSRLHSAGHVVDMAVNALGYQWIPGKGFHFPEGPYVEYGGSLAGLDKEKLKTDIERVANEFVDKGCKTTPLFMNKEDMKTVCRFVPDNLPEGKPGRVVMYGDFGVPCGGTHVTDLALIKHITIRKIKDEKGALRVSYSVQE